MSRLRQYLRLARCLPRLWAAVASKNQEALDNTVSDIEDAHRLLGHDYDESVIRK